MLGPVNLFTDYTVDIAALRAEAERVVKQSRFWDGKRFDLVVIDSKESTLQIRVVVSGKNSGNVGGLQSEVREKLVTYLQRSQPHALPKTRIELQRAEIQSA